MANENNLYGLGRRKSAVAQVILHADASDRTVNGKPFAEYLPTAAMQAIALKSLTVASLDDTHGFSVKAHGGGKNSQAQAISLAIARALVGADETQRKQLRAAGQLTRDPRAKERKKPGLKRARRAPQFSKR